MDLVSLSYPVLLAMFLCLRDIWSLTLQASVDPLKPVLGDIGFTLKCRITFADGEIPLGAILARKRETDLDFSQIVSFPPPSFLVNITYFDEELKSRTVATDSNTLNPTLTFRDTKCSDIAQYRWKVTYFTTGPTSNETLLDVKVKVESSFTGSSDFGVNASTSNNVQEGTNVTFTCKANVGNEPKGDLVWHYYLTNPGVPYPISNLAVKKDPVTYNICSYSQESTLTMKMTPDLNGLMMRCTVQQNATDNTDNEDNHRQTNPFNVIYSPRQTNITSNPAHPVYSEGEPELTLTCTSAANPVASFFWLLPDGSEIQEQIYQLRNLQINNTGNYTCVAKNGVPNENYTDSRTIEVIVVEKTTTTTTTTPTTTPSTAAPKNNTTKSGSAVDSEPQTDTTIIIIAVVVPVVVITIIVIIAICICRKKKSKEIEEPPEKPRNNQEINIAIYRPGLTTSNDSLKNSGNNLNTSFNSFESGDSKPRNDDGLTYSELQFDDKPRSRKPIQILDDGLSTQYADIAMPRV